MSSLSRRRFVALAGSGLGATLLSACSLAHAVERPEVEALAAAIPSPTPTPRPIPPRSKERMFLLPGTEWEAEGIAIHSGQAGPRIMVIGGVHGNEPGGWEAAEAIAKWQVERGSLLVFPRLNWRSAAVMERTLTGFGDLNRLYPGNPTSTLPMARVAAAVIEAGRAFGPELLFDLHESWVFYQERGSNSGTAFIGQTVSVGGGADDAAIDRISDVVRAVNAAITPREEFFIRGAARPRPGIQLVPANPTPTPGGPRPSATPPNGVTFNGTSSLSLGQWIPGCVPILIEMGQRDQAEARRSELHQMLVRTTLDQSGML